MKKAFVVIALIIVAAGAGYYVMKKMKPASSMVTTAPVPASSEMSSAASSVAVPTASSISSDTAVKTVDMEAGSFYYKPSAITVAKGQQVKIVFHSVSMMHNFNIDELNVHSEMVKNGNTATFEFTADKAGTFEYYCSVGKHRQLGQVGKLIVQ